MDELGGFEPTDTTGFIQIESIRIKKYVIRASVDEPMLIRLTRFTGGHKRTSAKDRPALSPRMCMGVVCD